MGWNTRQQMILALVPKVSSLFSLFGSMWIVVEVLSDNSNKYTATILPKRQHPHHRLLLAMSVYDILESVWNFVSTWAIPRDTAGVWHARGTTATCSAQGFFLTLSVAVPIYNAFLSLYYVMVINYGIKDETIAKLAEPCMHAVALTWALFTALYSLVTGLFNNANLWCWIAPLPGDCLDSRRFGNEASNCTRGDNAWIYRWAFYFAPLWLCIFFATVCTAMVYWKVQKYDRVTLKYRRPQSSFTIRNNNNNSDDSFRVSNRTGGATEDQGSTHGGLDTADDGEYGDESDDFSNVMRFGAQPQQQQEQPTVEEEGPKSSWIALCCNIRETLVRWRRRRELFREDHPRTYEVFQQSLWYLGVFYITHVWSTVNRTIQLINNGNTYYGLIVLHSFFDPLQGFLNYLVYQRPRFLRIRAHDPNLTWWQAMGKALTFSRFGGATMSKRTLSRTTALRRSQQQASSLRKSRNSSSSGGGGRDSEQPSSGEFVPDKVVSGTADVSIDVAKKSLGIIMEEDSSDLHESQMDFKPTSTTHTRERETTKCDPTKDISASFS